MHEEMQTRTLNVGQGSFKTALDFGSKTKLTLKIDNLQPVDLTLPPGVTLPSYEGSIRLGAAQVNQNFDVSANVHTHEWNSSETKTTETCTRLVSVRICGPVTRTINGHEVTTTECRDELETRFGDQDVEYHYHSSDTQVRLDLLTPGTSEQAGRFSGDVSNSDKIYDYQGPCVLDYEYRY